MRVRCNNCMSTFDENYIDVNIISNEECCPICGEIGYLMDMEETENYKRFRHVVDSNISITELLKFFEDLAEELQTEKKCPKCGQMLYCSDLPQYDYVCIECEENFYECEVK